jgi:hypothetical protein
MIGQTKSAVVENEAPVHVVLWTIKQKKVLDIVSFMN